MIRVDFYTNISDPIEYTCRLVRKISKQVGSPKRLVMLDDLTSCNAFDKALWLTDPSSFLPHCDVASPLAKWTPTLLTCDTNLQDVNCTLLINLSRYFPASIIGYQRILEVVGQSEPSLISARARYAQYKKLGHKLHHKST